MAGIVRAVNFCGPKLFLKIALQSQQKCRIHREFMVAVIAVQKAKTIFQVLYIVKAPFLLSTTNLLKTQKY